MKDSKKFEVSVAAGKTYKKSFRHSTASSAGAFQLTPVFYRELVPGSKIKGDGGFFCRSLPMSVPAMTDYDFKFHQFFVRYRDVWPAFDDFVTKTLHQYPAVLQNSPQSPAVPQERPYILMGDLCKMIVRSTTLCAAHTGSGVTDILYVDSNNVVSSFDFTRLGLIADKLLRNLGYRLTWREDDARKVNILPLFCFGKIFLDYFFPSNYAFGAIDWYTLASAFTTDLKNVRAGSSDNVVYLNALHVILNECTLVYFDNSIFYDAWDKPSASNQNAPSFLINDVSNNALTTNQYVTTDSLGSSPNVESPTSAGYKPTNGTPFVASGGNTAASASGVLTQFVLDSLKRVSNFVHRYQLAGSRLIDRWIVRYGLKYDDSHRAYRVKSDVIQLKIGDVEASSDSTNGTTTSVVGDLAGKGVALDGLHIDFQNESNTFGMFFVLMSCVMDNYIVSGMNRFNLHNTALHTWSPEFDGYAPSAISKREVFNSDDGTMNNDPDGNFGFTKNYYEYGQDRDELSGIFTAGSFGANEFKAWFPRKYFGPSTQQSSIVHDQAFMHPQSADLDAANLPFYDLKFSENFIYRVLFNNVEIWDKVKPLYQVFDFDEPENESIVVQSNGTKLN